MMTSINMTLVISENLCTICLPSIIYIHTHTCGCVIFSCLTNRREHRQRYRTSYKHMGKGGQQRSLEETPTWAVSICCLFFLIISFTIDGGLYKLTEFLRKRRRKSLNKALSKTKTEMMKFGFISFLLTISEAPISKICINKTVGNSFLPCQDPLAGLTKTTSTSATQVSTSEAEKPLNVGESAYDNYYCEAKGMVALVSREGIVQLNIFISVLAVFHILYCTFTMYLGMAKMRRWKRWEDETQTIAYQLDNDPRRFQLTGQTLVGKRHIKFWSNYPPLLWMVCFMRQFCGSVSKADYFTLRNGFIAANISEGSNFNFQKFLVRAYNEDFEQVVGIRFWIWIFSILFIFLSAHEFYNYYWLPFIPLVVVLVVGTKLQIIITKMCVESCKERPVIIGTLLVRPNDDYFWFGRPDWLLHLLQFILIQNSFQLAFFTWTWYEYGPRSCFNREKEDIGIRIAMGIAVQLLCGYVTLPLYALVTQMGSSMRKAVFTERVVKGLQNWRRNAKRSLSKNKSFSSIHSFLLRSKKISNSTKHSISLHSKDNSASSKLHSKANGNSLTETVENKHLRDEKDLPPLVIMSPQSVSTPGSRKEREKIETTHNQEISGHSTSEITSIDETNSKIITRRTYDSKISFRRNWKDMKSSRDSGEINSIVEEDNSDLLPELVSQSLTISQ